MDFESQESSHQVYTEGTFTAEILGFGVLEAVLMWSLTWRVGYVIVCLSGVAGGWSASGQEGLVSHLESRYDFTWILRVWRLIH